MYCHVMLREYPVADQSPPIGTGGSPILTLLGTAMTNMRSSPRALLSSYRRVSAVNGFKAGYIPGLQASRGLNKMPQTLKVNLPRYHSTSTSTSFRSEAIPHEVAGSSEVANTDLLEVYRGLVAQGKLQWDDEQVRCIMKVLLCHLLL